MQIASGIHTTCMCALDDPATEFPEYIDATFSWSTSTLQDADFVTSGLSRRGRRFGVQRNIRSDNEVARRCRHCSTKGNGRLYITCLSGTDRISVTRFLPALISRKASTGLPLNKWEWEQQL